MRVDNQNLLDDSGAVSLASSTSLSPVNLENIVNYSIQLTCTGTPDGTFKLQGSNDQGNINAASASQQFSGVSNWTDLGISVAVAAAGSYMLKDVNCGYNWVRVVWTANSAGTTPVLSAARSFVKGF